MTIMDRVIPLMAEERKDSHVLMEVMIADSSLLQDANSDRVSISSMGSGDPECFSLFDGDSGVDPDGFTSPKRDGGLLLSRPRRSPRRTSQSQESPTAPPRLFRQSSLYGRNKVLHPETHRSHLPSLSFQSSPAVKSLRRHKLTLETVPGTVSKYSPQSNAPCIWP